MSFHRSYQALLGVPLIFLVWVFGGTPLLAASQAAGAKVGSSENFSASPNLAKVYLKWDERYRQRKGTLTLRSEGTVIGGIRDQQYIAFDVLPGDYSFELYVPPSPHFEIQEPQRFTEFSLSLAANSVALLHCENGKYGRRKIKMTNDDVLASNEKHCPNGPNLDKAGIKSCIRKFEEPVKFRDYEYYLAPAGTCKLIEDSTGFTGYEPVAPAISTYLASEAAAYQLALNTSSTEGYRTFLRDRPQSARRSEIEALINSMGQQQDIAAWELEVNSALQRDSVLPLQAQHDKYMIALIGYLQQQDFESSLLYFELLDRLEVELSPSVTHFWGEALLRTGQPDAAIKKLYEYINISGPSGTYYRDALALLNEAEQK